MRDQLRGPRGRIRFALTIGPRITTHRLLDGSLLTALHHAKPFTVARDHPVSIPNPHAASGCVLSAGAVLWAHQILGPESAVTCGMTTSH